MIENAQSFLMKSGSHLMGQMIGARMSKNRYYFSSKAPKNGRSIMVLGHDFTKWSPVI